MCNGTKNELRLAWNKPTHEFYVYYVLAEDYRILTGALEKAHKVAPCILYRGHV